MTDPNAEPDIADIWRAYEAAQKHYDSDFTLFINRMNLFLVVQTALLAFTASQISRSGSNPAQLFLIIMGAGTSVVWLLVASGSYRWVKTWRHHMCALGEIWEARAKITPSAAIFSRQRREDARHGHNPNGLEFPANLEWYLRPTLTVCLLPVIFLAGWVALLFF